MIYDIDIAKQVSKSLLQINAIILQPENPFKWASGWNSPIYCDNRKILSYPNIRNYIRQSLSSIVKNHFKNANIIAGVATAGIPHGVLVAEEDNIKNYYIDVIFNTIWQGFIDLIHIHKMSAAASAWNFQSVEHTRRWRFIYI